MPKTLELVRPRFLTPAHTGYSRGDPVIDFCESEMTTLKGPRAGEDLRFLQWQKFAIERLYETTDVTGERNQHRTGVIGVGRQNGKSIIGSALATEALYRGPAGSEVYSAAGDRKQARIVFEESKRQIQRSQRLSALATIYRDAIEIPTTGNVYRVLSADAKLQQGLSPYFVVFDEVHVQPNDDLWDAMVFGMAARPNGMILGITTAGEHEDSLLGRLYEYGKTIADETITDDSFFMAWWEPTDRTDDDGKPIEVDLFDESGWLEANPSLAEGVLDRDELAQSARRSQPAAFRRFRLNQWVSHGGSRWMDMVAWDACELHPKKSKKRIPVVLSFDGSVDDDATALMVIRTDLEKPVEVETFVWERSPEDPDTWQVDREDVNETVKDLFKRYRVIGMGCDPAYWRSEMQAWEKAHGRRKIVEWNVTNARMGPACTEAYKRVKEGEFGHSGNEVVRRHVRNAITKAVAGGHVTIRKQTPDSEHKIDAAVTVVIGIDMWDRYHELKSEMKSL